MDKVHWFPIACLALMVGVIIGLMCGVVIGKETGYIEGKCAAYESFIVAARVQQDPRLFPLDCPQRRTV